MSLPPKPSVTRSAGSPANAFHCGSSPRKVSACGAGPTTFVVSSTWHGEQPHSGCYQHSAAPLSRNGVIPESGKLSISTELLIDTGGWVQMRCPASEHDRRALDRHSALG
jgi:hypothetical protein